MALYYLETSALVKLYVREPGTERLLKLAARANNHRFAVLSLSRIEFHSAIRRREREGDVETTLAQRLLARFDEHMETKFLKQVLNDSVLDISANLLARHPIRAYDAIQLAGCLMLNAVSGQDHPTFVCSDRRLIEAAENERLTALDPTS